MTQDEQEARTRSSQLFRAYLGMLGIVQATATGWADVADVLEDAARDARSRAIAEPGE
jgi:hypothetical protein